MQARGIDQAKFSRHAWQGIAVFGCLLIAALVVAACSSGGSANTASGTGMGTVSVMLSDPATCQAPSGPYSHVWVTITDVQASVSSTASASDSSWTDLTPNLSKSPRQIDLLGQANNQCFLATLGDSLQLQAGNYQQIRLILAANSSAITNSVCGTANNCVVLAADGSTHTLNLSSEAQTGIKIPSGQIANGAFAIAAGQTKDLDIDFNTCCSIVLEGNGQYRMKPVLWAGEVSTTSTSINGTVVDGNTGKPVNGSVLVAVEQKDSTGVERVERSTLAGPDGTFVFCPLPSGTYDVVIVGARSDGAMYAPSIITGVSLGNSTGIVQLNIAATATAATSVTNLNGEITSQNGSNQGTVADVTLTALTTIGTASPATYTIPLPPTSTQSSFGLAVETAAPTGTNACTPASGVDCVNYSMSLPASGVSIGAWSASGATLSANATWGNYVVDGAAVLPGSGGAADCSPSELKSAAITLTAAGTQPVSTLGFTGCQ